MALPRYLTEIKSSGVYRVTIDESQVTGLETSPLRLLIGSSRKGVFNAPVQVETFEEFKSVFGDIDRTLERRGSYFHRMAQEMLKAGQGIYCLSLRDFDDALDVTERVSLSARSEDPNEAKATVSVTSIYDRSGFWRLNPRKLDDNTTNLINFVAVGDTSATVFIKKTPFESPDADGLRFTASEWYADEPDFRPEYVDPLDYITDYMITAYVFQGDYTDYLTLSTDPVLGNFFDIDGLKKTYIDINNQEVDTLEAMSRSTGTGFLGKYVGSLIQGFQDRSENILDFESIFNSEVNTHGLMCAISEEILDDYTEATDYPLIDLIGKSVFDPITPSTSLNFISYNISTLPTGVVDMQYTATLTNPVVPDDPLATKDPAIITLDNLVSKTSDDLSFQIHDVYQVGVGDYLEGANGYFSRVVGLTVVEEATGARPVDIIEVTLDSQGKIVDTGGILSIRKFVPIEEQEEPYKGVYLKGYSVRDAQLPNGTLTRQNEIFDILNDEGIRGQLTDKNAGLSYRYLIDSYETYLTTDMKSSLSKLAGENQNVRVITNMPFIDSFERSVNPYFTDASTSKFSFKYLTTGGNTDRPYTNLISMPSTLSSPSHMYFYGSAFKINDRGRVKNFPVAGNVSNLFLSNFDINPVYTVIAGVTNGRVPRPDGFISMERDFTQKELDYLEPFGFNAILFRAGFDLVINSQRTAQQRNLTSLSYINVKELEIEIGIEVDTILERYRNNAFNNEATRNLIRSEVESVMENYRTAGIVSSYTVTMDRSNNTQEVLDRQMGVIDISFRPVANLSKLVLVQRIGRFGS